MQQGYEAVARDIQKLEHYLLTHEPALLYYTPLIRRQNLDHYKLATKGTRQAQSQRKWLQVLQALLPALLTWFSPIRNKKADYFLLEHGSKRSALVEGSYFNRLADALSHFLQASGKVALAEIIEHTGQWKTKRWQPALNLFPIIIGVNIRLRIRQWLGEASEHTKSVHALASIIKEQGLELIYINPSQLVSDLIRIELFKVYFAKILKQTQARLVFNFCYYSKEAFGLTLAAKSLNIPVVEVQHGSQSPAHPMYAAYHGLQAGGQQLLPDVFWVWSSTEKTYFEGWTNKAEGITVFRGGNPWLAFAKKSLTKHERPSNTEKGKKVLISLQEPQYFHESFLADLIEAHPRDVHWLLRVHPLYAELEEDLLDRFAGQENVHIRGVAQQNLYEQFSMVDLHITAFSTTCLEALEFQVPTILIHPNGQAYFSTYLEAGYFKYADEQEECWKIIEENNFVSAPRAILQGDETAIKQAISYLETKSKN